MSILDQRCFHHDTREAVAQCPSCKLFFCRECVTEHAGRMICVTCVNALTRDAGESARAARARWTVTALAGLLVAWLVFYYLGLALARIPSKFHGAPDESLLPLQQHHDTAKTWGLTTLSPGATRSCENAPTFGAAWTERSVPMSSPRPHTQSRLSAIFAAGQVPDLPSFRAATLGSDAFMWGSRFRLPTEPQSPEAIPT